MLPAMLTCLFKQVNWQRIFQFIDTLSTLIQYNYALSVWTEWTIGSHFKVVVILVWKRILVILKVCYLHLYIYIYMYVFYILLKLFHSRIYIYIYIYIPECISVFRHRLKMPLKQKLMLFIWTSKMIKISNLELFHISHISRRQSYASTARKHLKPKIDTSK